MSAFIADFFVTVTDNTFVNHSKSDNLGLTKQILAQN